MCSRTSAEKNRKQTVTDHPSGLAAFCASFDRVEEKIERSYAQLCTGASLTEECTQDCTERFGIINSQQKLARRAIPRSYRSQGTFSMISNGAIYAIIQAVVAVSSAKSITSIVS